MIINVEIAVFIYILSPRKPWCLISKHSLEAGRLNPAFWVGLFEFVRLFLIILPFNHLLPGHWALKKMSSVISWQCWQWKKKGFQVHRGSLIWLWPVLTIKQRLPSKNMLQKTHLNTHAKVFACCLLLQVLVLKACQFSAVTEWGARRKDSSNTLQCRITI